MRILPVHRKLSVLERCRASPFVKTGQLAGRDENFKRSIPFGSISPLVILAISLLSVIRDRFCRFITRVRYSVAFHFYFKQNENFRLRKSRSL